MAEHPDVALVRRGYDAFSTGDVGTLSEVIAPDATQYQPGSGDLAGEHKGLQAILEFYGRLAAETDGSFRVQLDRLYTDGMGRVVAHPPGHRSASGSPTGHRGVADVHHRRRDRPGHPRLPRGYRRVGRVLGVTAKHRGLLRRSDFSAGLGSPAARAVVALSARPGPKPPGAGGNGPRYRASGLSARGRGPEVVVKYQASQAWIAPRALREAASVDDRRGRPRRCHANEMPFGAFS
jgi:ketosteroid isomerase-like protein